MAEPEGTGPDRGRTTSASPLRRRQVIDELCEAFARDRIDLADLERRLEEAARARTDAELASLVSTLPAVVDPAPASDPMGTVGEAPARSGGSSGTTRGTEVGQRSAGPVATVDAGRVAARSFTVAFWSGRTKKGRWIPARRTTVIAFQGGVDLDFREAMFGSPVTELHVLAIMGGVDIKVPPGVQVETSGFAVMGGFEDEGSPDPPPGEGAPILRITGMALMGGVDVRVLLPGETDREARQRKRQARRDAALERETGRNRGPA